MSTSICSEKSGIVAFDSAIRRAIVAWVRVSSTTVVSPLAVATPSSTAAWPPGSPAPPRVTGAGRRPGAAVAGPRSRVGRAGAALPAASTSAFTIRPPGPEPASVCRSMPLSRASLRASGEALILPASAAVPARRRGGGRCCAGARARAAATCGRSGGRRCGGCRCRRCAALPFGQLADGPRRRAPGRRGRSPRRSRAWRPRGPRSRALPPGRTRRSWRPCRFRSRPAHCRA